MQLQSNDFSHQGKIPRRFTCDGEDASPHLEWSGAPPQTKSFALSCFDPDAPAGTWAHWLIVGIPAAVTEIPQGQAVGREVVNDFGYSRYGGPCPPSGQHRYFFTVYALDVEELDGVSRDNFMEKVEKHAIGSAELMGIYRRV